MRFGDLAGFLVQYAQGPEGVPLLRPQGKAGVEDYVGFSGYELIVAEALVAAQVGHHERSVRVQDGMRTKGIRAGGLPAGHFDAVFRLVPLPVLGHQTDLGYRRLADLSGQGHQVFVFAFG